MLKNPDSMNIVFLYPGIYLSGSYKDVIKGVTLPPQGICHLAAVTREMGIDTSIIDAMALQLSKEEVLDEINKKSPNLLGISSTTMQINAAHEIAISVKKSLPNCVILLGGPHISAVPEETMKRFPSFDIGFIGEAELTIKEYLTGNKQLSEIDGLIFRKGTELIKTNPRSFIKDLDELPLPAWDLLPNLGKHYQQSVARVDRIPAASITTSRGCPYHCIFCARNVFGSSFRGHSSGYIIKMLDFLISNYNIRSVSFEDENFIATRVRFREICEELIKRNYRLKWGFAGRVDLLNKEDIILMKRAGCTNISFGIESGSQKILNILNKGLTLDKIVRGIQMTTKAGIRARGYFIMGSPGETLETIQETIDFAKRTPFAEVQMSHMCPFPGTDLYKTATEYGTFDNNWEKLNIWTPVFVPDGLTGEILRSELKRFHKEFYFRPKIIFKYMKRVLKLQNTLKFIRDGFTILKFIIKKS